ncbi:MAG: hypothetical protein GXW85_12300 [Clostridia bacterium]|nr:hypothetical protein [Clostridia bacterium]
MLKKGNITGAFFNELIKELIVLAEMEGAESTCLNIIENTPAEIQQKILQSLAKTNSPKLIPFFQMIARETEGKVQKIAQNALRKFLYLGYEIKPYTPQKIKADDIQAFISLTRLEGACILVFIHRLNGKYHAYYFSLAFNSLGIKEYFQYSSVHKEDLLNIIEKQNLLEIDFGTAQRILKDAYLQNKRYGTKTAGGFSQYQFLLTIEQNEINNIDLFRLTDKELEPEKLINVYFFALKNMDASLVYDLAAPNLQKRFGSREDFINNWVHPLQKYTFVKSILLDKEESSGGCRARCQLIAGNEKDELEKIDFCFVLKKIRDFWRFAEVNIECIKPVGVSEPVNPLNYQVYVSVYKINNHSLFRNIFDSWDKVNLTGEFDGGNCYKWFKTGNLLEMGIDVSRDIYGEFILTNEELIIFSGHLQNLTEVGCHCQEHILKNKGAELHLLAKGPCRVRDVYRVITEKEFSLSKFLANNHRIYYLNLAENNKYCYTLLQKEAEKKYMIQQNIQVLELAGSNLEAVNQDKHVLIFTYNNYDKAIEKKWPDLWKNIKDITFGREYEDEKEKWQYYKLISYLKKHPFTQIFVPHVSRWEMAKRMGIVK